MIELENASKTFTPHNQNMPLNAALNDASLAGPLIVAIRHVEAVRNRVCNGELNVALLAPGCAA